MSRAERWTTALRWVLVCGLYLGGGVLATAGISHPGLVNERGGLIPLVRGEAFNPYARRVLAPGLIRVIRWVLPPSVRDAAERKGRAMSATRSVGGGEDAAVRRSRMEGNWDYALAGAILNVASFSVFILALRGLLVTLFKPPPVIADLVPLSALLVVPITGEFSTLAYDYPQLALFTLGLWMMASGRFLAYWVLLPIGMLNKETFILLPLIYLVAHPDGRPPMRRLANVGLQLAVCGAVLAATVVACRHHPGTLVENHIASTLRSMGHPGEYVRFMRPAPSPLAPGGVNFPIPVGWNLPALLVLGAVIAPGWREAPAFLRRAVPVVLVPLVLLTLFFGVWWELRDYLEVMPLVLLLVYAGFRKIWDIEPSPR